MTSTITQNIKDLIYTGLRAYFYYNLDKKLYTKTQKDNMELLDVLIKQSELSMKLSINNGNNSMNNLNSNSKSNSLKVENKADNNNNNSNKNNKQLIGDYEVEKVLGQGGEGIVYLVYINLLKKIR
jgi:hypothetical protein